MQRKNYNATSKYNCNLRIFDKYTTYDSQTYGEIIFVHQLII